MGGEKGIEPLKLSTVDEQQYVLSVMRELIQCDYPLLRHRDTPGIYGFGDQHPLITDLNNVIDRQKEGEEIHIEIVGVEADVLRDALERRVREKSDLYAQAIIEGGGCVAA